MPVFHDQHAPSVAAFVSDVMPLLCRTASGGRAVADARSIVETDRWNSFDQFRRTTRTIAAAFEQARAHVEVYRAPTGGQSGTGRWIIQEAADVSDAVLELIEPERRLIADYRANPWHVVQWTSATPPDGAICPLTVVDTEEQLARLKPQALAGKMVLTRLKPWDYRRKFVEKGAYGVIADPPVENCPDAVAWVKFGWGGLSIADATARLVGLAISSRQGDELRRLLAYHGRAVVRVKVDVRRYAGWHDVVSGVIHGRDDPQNEVWAIAHSSEPGALDNASGVACCLEASRIINALIAAGSLPRPRRSIRFVAGYECYGFFHYYEHQRRFMPPLAGLCVDTVGARPDVCRGLLRVHQSVPGSASFVDDLLEVFTSAALRIDNPGYSLERKPFVSTDDTLLGDPKYGFPCPWLTNHPCKGYHSSADTPEMLDERGLAACAAAVAAYLYYLADAGTTHALELADWHTQSVAARLRASPNQAHVEVLTAGHAASIQRLKLWLWGGDRSEILARLDRCAETIREEAARRRQQVPAPQLPPLEGSDADELRRSLDLLPFRRTMLAPTAENVMPPLNSDIAGFPRWSLYWADGRRVLRDIALLMLAEPGARIDLPAMVRFFRAAEELGYVKLVDRADLITRQRLVGDLRRLGLRPGMDVMVHSSLSRMGPVDGGADTVIDAIIEAISPGGTLLAPSFNHLHARVFNPLTTATTNGAIPQALWQRREAVRSMHPTHAVAAIGPRAGWYTAGHLERGIWDQDSPIGRLVHNGGWILLLGVTSEAATAYHVGETSLRVPCLDQFGSIDRIVMPDGTVRQVPSLAWRDNGCPVSIKKIDETLDARGLQKHGRVGLAEARLVRAVDVWNVRREHIRDVCPTCHVRPYYRR